MAAVIARHELHHARRTWLRAQNIAELANRIETRMRQHEIGPADRNRLELIVNQGMAASEEIEAIDRSLEATVLPAAQRTSILRYREDNRIHLTKVLKQLQDLFIAGDQAADEQELGRWLVALFHHELK